MGKIAFVFSGQGDQKAGMCRDLYDNNKDFKAMMDELSQVYPELYSSIYETSDEELKKTINTQPALYAIETAIATVLTQMGIKADVAAGFSLGEISALAYAGSFSAKEGMEIVRKRAAFMQDEAEKFDTSMTAVVRLTEEEVSEAAEKYENIYPVNYNCPGQIVCSGLLEELDSFEKDVKAMGGRAIRLSVKGGFHSPFMEKAAESFEEYLDTVFIAEPKIETYSNYLGAPYGTSIKKELCMQIKSPVLWQKSVEMMIASGVDTFIEIGPGSTLTGLIKKIDKNVRTFPSGSLENIEKIKEALC